MSVNTQREEIWPQWNYQKKVPTRPILQDQISKITFFISLKKKSSRSYEFWKFQIQGPNNQFGVAQTLKKKTDNGVAGNSKMKRQEVALLWDKHH